jgi:cytidylate kinase
MPNKHGQLVIAVDGTSASGKSTLSNKLADILSAQRLEYSLFFRMIAQHMLDQGFVPSEGAVVTDAQKAEAAHYASSLTWDTVRALKDDPSLRTIAVSRAAPFFSGLPEVLASTDAVIRTLVDASRDRSVVVEGRTIGRYVYPEADVKFFVDADLPVRGARRAASLRDKGKNETDDAATADLARRDEQDQTRAHQPTGFDAAIQTRLDTSHQEISETLADALNITYQKRDELLDKRCAALPHKGWEL